MNKVEFMRQLESLLQNISEQERQEALQYYDDYFNDAGPENEQAVIEALGNPARVAENIRRDLYGAGYGDGYENRKAVTGRELAEYGEDTEETQKQESAFRQEGTANGTWQEGTQSRSGQAGGKSDTSGKKQLSGGMIALIVVLCILAAPVVLGLVGGAVGVIGSVLGGLVGVVIGWFALILGFGVAALVCMVVGAVVAVIGGIGITIHPLAGVGIIGGGLITVGIGILFMMLAVAMAGGITPAIFRGIGRLFSHKKKAA